MAPNRSHKQNKKGAANASRAFDEAALSQLTAKIDKNLSKSGEAPGSGKRKRDDRDSNDHKSNKRQAQPQADGRKDRKRSDKPKQSADEKLKTLLEEIKALGGDEGDLDLVAGIDSDAEEGASASKTEQPLDDSFKSELAKFASGLGFDKVRDDEEEEEEEEENGENAYDEDDDEEDEDDEEVDEEEQVSSQPAPTPVEDPKGRKAKSKLIFEARPDWHGLSQDGLPQPTTDEISEHSQTISSMKTFAQGLLDTDTAAYNTSVAASSTRKFMSTIMSSGTMSDKVSALTLAVQESPVHNIKALENLMNLAGKKSRGQAIAALGALVDLLGNGVVLPNDRRLRSFHMQPGLLGALQHGLVTHWRPGQKLPGQITEAHLIMWVFEDWLKDAYFKIIQLLEVWCGDEIEYSRSRALDFVFGLLRDKPEQEANLLRLLVNKLGDRERKIASRASYLLLQLLNIHPGMKAIVINMIEQEALLRPGQSIRTKYYAINTLNQTILSTKEPSTADTLIRIYFDLFVSLLKAGALESVDTFVGDQAKGKQDKKKPAGRKPKPGQKKDVNAANERETAEKLVSAILTGINRAIPFAATDESTLEKHLDTLFRITHSSNFNTSIQALVLIQQVATTKQLAIDRFYRTLYESLLDPRLITSSKQALYLNLLYRSLKNDVDVRRVKAFVKRMLQIVNIHQPSFACGVLYLVFELESTFPDLKTLLNDPEDNEDDEEIYRDADVDGETNGAPVNDEPKLNKRAYDGRKRDPEYSNADQSCLWELVPFLNHFHPSVKVFASNLLVKQKNLPKPELANHTLMHFLDKFVYRNPKAAETKRGTSIMQPVLAAGSSSHIVAPGKDAARHQPTVNSAAFWNKKSEDVAAEDIFFHQYFTQVGKPAEAAKAKAKKEAAEQEDEDSEAEDEIWQAMLGSRPEIQGDEDADVDMDDMDEEGDSELASLLNMSDSDEDGSDVEGMDEDIGSDMSDGGVEFHDFSGDEDEEAELEQDEDEEEEEETKGKGKSASKASRERKKKLKALPTFASVDDYAEMLGQEEDEDYA